MENEDKLSIVLLSDIHMNHQNIKKFIEWFNENGTNIKYIFLLGDFHNIDNDQVHSEQEELDFLEDVYKLISPIANLNRKCFMIPGNHDPKILFTPEYKCPLNIESIHNKVLILAEGIRVIGFGGSVPAFSEGKLQWKGYPYISDEELELQIKYISQEITSQTILVTHCGPSISSTTDSYQDYKKITSGSDAFTRLLKNNSNEIIVQVHGHTHDGHGYRLIQNLQIVNAGPLVWGKFTVIDFNRITQEGLIKKQWVVQNVHILSC